MKIAVNLAYLTSEQVKCLSQLGEFRGERTWEAACDPDDFEEAVDLLKRAGIEDVFVRFGHPQGDPAREEMTVPVASGPLTLELSWVVKDGA